MEENEGRVGEGRGAWGSESTHRVPCRRMHQQICIVGWLDDESPAGRAVGLVHAVHCQYCALDLAPADEAGQVLLRAQARHVVALERHLLDEPFRVPVRNRHRFIVIIAYPLDPLDGGEQPEALHHL